MNDFQSLLLKPTDLLVGGRLVADSEGAKTVRKGNAQYLSFQGS